MPALYPHYEGATDENSPLEALAMGAIRRFGHLSAGGVDGELLLLFIEWANRVIDEYNAHPYREAETLIEYYTHQSEVREIPDMLMVDGLTYNYALQQASQKAGMFQQTFYRNMNQRLYMATYGTSLRHNLAPPELSDGSQVETV